MKRALGAILFVIYAIIAITVTVLLLSFNEYNCSEIGGYTIFSLDNDGLEPDYEEGSILIVKETNDKHVQIGDEIFLYKVVNSQEFELVNRKLVDKIQQGRHIVYQVEGGEYYDTTYFIGKADDATVIGSPWGTILSILESKWGYLFCIVIVSLLLFLQEVFDLVIELKYGGTKGTKSANVAHARKTASKNNTNTKTRTKTTSTKTATTAKTVAKTVANVTKSNETAKTIETGEKED